MLDTHKRRQLNCINLTSSQYRGYLYIPLDTQPSTRNPQPLDPQPPRPTTIPNYPLDLKLKMGDLGLVYNRVRPIGGPFSFIT